MEIDLICFIKSLFENIDHSQFDTCYNINK